MHNHQEGDGGYNRGHMFRHLQRVRVCCGAVPLVPPRVLTVRHNCSYVEHEITEAEFGTLNSRGQDQVKRTAAQNFSNQMQPQGGWGGFYTPQPAPDRLHRVGA